MSDAIIGLSIGAALVVGLLGLGYGLGALLDLLLDKIRAAMEAKG